MPFGVRVQFICLLIKVVVHGKKLQPLKFSSGMKVCEAETRIRNCYSLSGGSLFFNGMSLKYDDVLTASMEEGQLDGVCL